jgi:catechol 2,3-dioxygenase-like lactoylglutathione lyase family enzyme
VFRFGRYKSNGLLTEFVLRINHIDLHVPDVKTTRDFLRENFGLSCVCSYDADGFAILRDCAGFELGLGQLADAAGGTYAAGLVCCDIGFMLPSYHAFVTLLARLRAAGAEVRLGSVDTHGVSAFCCLAPGGVTLQVAWQPARHALSGSVPYMGETGQP